MKKIKILIILILFALLQSYFFSEDNLKKNEYFRIVVLGDPHLPSKHIKPKDKNKKEKIVAAKNSVIEDINSWEDVNLVVAVGDVTALTGSDDEYNFAKEFFSRLKVDFLPIAGNHDFLYKTNSGKSSLNRATKKEATEKLKKFESLFNLESISYTKEISNYLLVFLSPDTVYNYNVELSNKSLLYLKKILEQNKEKPTIIFFHAPLEGTLLIDNSPNRNNKAAQPASRIRKILKDNKQVFLWVSGHTHTPVTDKSYNANFNLYNNQVLNIHNADMDRSKIWTNSIYLYKDKVLIKTYDHKAKKWIDDLERTIPLPLF